jgi:hypothetical protein
MVILAVGIEYPLDVAIQCPQHANARVQQRPAIFGRHQQRLDRGLPMVALGFFPRQGMDVFASVEQGDELATVGKGDWILEQFSPAGFSHQANISAPAGVNST